MPQRDAPCPHCGSLLWFSVGLCGLYLLEDSLRSDVEKEVLRLVQTYENRDGSHALVELIMELEEICKIQIDDEAYEKILTPAGLLHAIRAQLR